MRILLSTFLCALPLEAMDLPSPPGSVAASPPPFQSETALPPSALPAPPDLTLHKIDPVFLGSSNDVDPFGVEIGGPLDKQTKFTEDAAPVFTLKDAVGLLTIQAIFPNGHDCFINDVLLAEGASFYLVHTTGRYKIALVRVNKNGITFSWDQDSAGSLFTYTPPSAFDPLSAHEKAVDPTDQTLPVFDTSTKLPPTPYP